MISEEVRNDNYYNMICSHKLGEQEEAVFRMFFLNPNSSDEEIADLLLLPHSSVCGRRNELAKKGLIAETGTKLTKIGSRVTLWSVVIKGEQSTQNTFNCLSDKEMRKIESMLLRANTFQKEKIKGWL